MRKLIGDKNFYRRLLSVMTPVLIQNVITNFVSLLDNIMVGRVGTEPMSGVAIVNQLIFVFNLSIFGIIAGAGIFTAQFYGKGDHKGIRDTMRIKWYFVLGVIAVFETVFLLFEEPLINAFLHESDSALDLAATFGYAKEYLHVMLFQLPLFGVMQIYAGTLRETGETRLPMRAGIIAVLVNLVFNYILIFGKLGAPALGVKGAAIATVLARAVECSIIIVKTHCNKDRHKYIQGLYESPKVPAKLLKQISVMGAPLLMNELLWSSGMTILNQCYSMRGLEVVSAMNISTTVSNLFFCAFFAMGTTVSIMVGQLLGAGEIERAIDEDRKLIAFAVALCAVVGVVMVFVCPYVPYIYNTTDAVRKLAAEFLLVCACMMPLNAFTNSCYFTLRSGGKTWITFLFDSAFVWTICVPVAFVLSRFTQIPILQMYIAIQALEIIKCVSGFVLVKSRRWANNLVG